MSLFTSERKPLALLLMIDEVYRSCWSVAMELVNRKVAPCSRIRSYLILHLMIESGGRRAGPLENADSETTSLERSKIRS